MGHCGCPDAVILPACRRKARAVTVTGTTAVVLALLLALALAPAVLGMCLRYVAKAAGQLNPSTRFNRSRAIVWCCGVGVVRVVAGDVPMWGTESEIASLILPRSSFCTAVAVDPSNNQTDAVIVGGTDEKNLLGDSYRVVVGTRCSSCSAPSRLFRAVDQSGLVVYAVHRRSQRERSRHAAVSINELWYGRVPWLGIRHGWPVWRRLPLRVSLDSSVI